MRVKVEREFGGLVGICCQVDEGVWDGIELIGVCPDATRVKVMVTAEVEGNVVASAASAMGARKSKRCLRKYMLTEPMIFRRLLWTGLWMRGRRPGDLFKRSESS